MSLEQEPEWRRNAREEAIRSSFNAANGNRNERTYLGDGLYVEYDGAGWRLTAPRFGLEHWVYLEPGVLTSFFRYIEQQSKVRITVAAVTKGAEA